MKEDAIEIVRELRRRGHQALLVGGCVRDILLEREPADYDVATDATPDQVMSIFPKTYAVGAQFGVVLVASKAANEATNDAASKAAGEHSGKEDCTEVATFRSDGRYSDSRHPDEVRFTDSAEEDVRRRDFTINGLLLDPLKENQILDYVGGRADLAAGIIRTIGPAGQRFQEDKLRMLRAVRFAARFEYRIEPEAMEAIQNLAGETHRVSGERVRDELIKMLTEGHAGRAFELLEESRLLHEILPEVEKMKGVEQPPQFHPEGDVWTHTLLMLDALPAKCSPTLAMGALLHDVGKPPTFRVAPDRIRFDGHVEVGSKMAEAICRRLRFSNDDTAQILSLVGNHMRFAEVKKMRESTLKRFLRLPRFEEQLELHRMDCRASHGDLSLYEFAREKLAVTPAEQIRPRPLITGDDLISEGYLPGPRFKEILAACEDAQLEGTVSTRDEAMEFVRRNFPSS